MRECTICGRSKLESEFFYRNRKLERLHSQCKQCYVIKRGQIWRNHYHKYGSQYRKRAVERNKRIKDKIKSLVLEYLGDKACVRCGISDPRVLEFDHVDPSTKDFSIARAIASTYSWKKILLEIEKCQILCANCHKIKTAEEVG